VFGRRRREEEAAAEAAREAERRALFARLAERPEHICPFLGLADERSGYVDGVSDEHRCFAFGDPTPLSAEQQTRVCQERGYGNCPRYLRGVLVIPTEELEALRRPRAGAPPPVPPPVAAAAEEPRRRRSPILVLLLALLLLVGGAGAYLVLGQPGGVAQATPTPSVPSPSASPSASSAPASPSASSAPASPSASGLATPTPEPTPEQGDAFAFYEVSVGPTEYQLFAVDGDGTVGGTRTISFADFSYARAEAREGDDGAVYWVTLDGDLVGYGYRWPDSGPFRIRAVFLADDGTRRSFYLDEDELTTVPTATPAPVP
jgi:hypothetical protein